MPSSYADSESVYSQQSSQRSGWRKADYPYAFDTPQARVDSSDHLADARAYLSPSYTPKSYESRHEPYTARNPIQDRHSRTRGQHVPSPLNPAYRDTRDDATISSASSVRRTKPRPRSNSFGESTTGSLRSFGGLSIGDMIIHESPAPSFRGEGRSQRSSGVSAVLPPEDRLPATRHSPLQDVKNQATGRASPSSIPWSERAPPSNEDLSAQLREMLSDSDLTLAGSRSGSPARPPVSRAHSTPTTGTSTTYHSSREKARKVSPTIVYVHPPAPLGLPTPVHVPASLPAPSHQRQSSKSPQKHPPSTPPKDTTCRNASGDIYGTVSSVRSTRTTRTTAPRPLQHEMVQVENPTSSTLWLSRTVSESDKVVKARREAEREAARLKAKPLRAVETPLLHWRPCMQESSFFTRIRGNQPCCKGHEPLYDDIIFQSLWVGHVSNRDRALDYGFWVSDLAVVSSQIKLPGYKPLREMGFEGSERPLKLHMLWPGYDRWLTRELDTQYGQVSMVQLAEFAAKTVHDWWEKVDKRKRCWMNEGKVAEWRIVEYPGQSGVTLSEVLVTGLEHRGDNHWQLKLMKVVRQ